MKKISRRHWIKLNGIVFSAALFAPSSVFSTVNHEKKLSFKPDWKNSGMPLKHTWEGLGNVDQMRWILRGDMQQQLKQAQKELHVKHIRAVGIFDNELQILSRDPTIWLNDDPLVPRINYQVMDYIFDSLMEMGINPMFTTCFMPSHIASGTTTVFETQQNVTLPKDYNQWTSLIKKCIQHLTDRYGRDTIRGWYFEVWNEPNLRNFFDGTKEDYFAIWKVTYDAIKSIDANYKVGGPSTARAEWIEDFIKYGRKNNCEADFIIAHCYNNDSDGDTALSPFAGPQQERISKSPSFTAGVVRGVRKLADYLNFKGEIHFNEWGRSWFPYDPVRESANEAAFIVKTMSEVSQLADYFAYWCMSDIYNQAGYGAETFHSNYGMMNLQGLRKPSYQAFQLLSKMGTMTVPVAEHKNASALQNIFVSRTNSSVHILVFAFDPNYKPENSDEIIPVEIYLPATVKTETFQLFRINGKENNTVNKWKEMGSPATLSKKELEILKGYNILKPSKNAVSVLSDSKGKKALFNLAKPGIALLEFKI